MHTLTVALQLLTLVPELRIGSEDRGPAYQFTDITQVVPAGGRVFVAERQLTAIRAFDAQGRYLYSIGRRGAGPGEFEWVQGIGLLGDTLWATDGNQRRVTYFDLSGKVQRTVRLTPLPSRGAPTEAVFFPYPVVLVSGDTMLGFGASSGRAIAMGQVTARPLLTFARDGRTRDTLGWASLRHEDMILRSERSIMYREQPFSDAPLLAFAARARRVYMIERWVSERADSASFRVTAWGAGARQPLWTRSYPYTPRVLPASQRDSVRDRHHRLLRPRFSTAEVERALFAPRFVTPVAQAVAADDGALWIGLSASGRTTEFLVLDARGDVRSRARAPAGTRLAWVSDSLAWGQERDEDGVPTLVRYRIRRS